MDKVCSPIAESQLSTIEFVKKEKKEQNQERNSCRDDQFFFFFPYFFTLGREFSSDVIVPYCKVNTQPLQTLQRKEIKVQLLVFFCL